MKQPRNGILLISCYELGHQPSGISMPAGFLAGAGYAVDALDVSVQGFDRDKVRDAWFVGISVPMHTALRLGVAVAREVRKVNAKCHICFYGLYASLNRDHLLVTVADSVIGGEVEEALLLLVQAVESAHDRRTPVGVPEVTTRSDSAGPVLKRLDFALPSRNMLPSLKTYAKLEYKGEERLAGYVEATRGCLHNCTHCPIPPVYGGRFFAVPRETVLSDIGQLVAAGAAHITFGDPDFLNGPGHSLRILESLHHQFPAVTFDFTAKVEHILKHRELFPQFAKLGCLFVVSAVESLSDRVLARLDKGHTRDHVYEALRILRQAGIELRPSFVSFTPWTEIDDYIDVLEFVESEELVDNVEPVQYSIRLLVPPGSLLLSQPDARDWIGSLVQETFTYEWTHPDPRMDELHRHVSRLVEAAAERGEDAPQVFGKISDLAYALKGEPAAPRRNISPVRLKPPRLTEAWFC